jgi:hypothetical protein
MKIKFLTVASALALTLGGTSRGLAQSGPTAVVVDVVVARPLCLAVTAVGSVFFVAALPFAAASDSVKETAEILVVKPAKATFIRKVGDLDALTD